MKLRMSYLEICNRVKGSIKDRLMARNCGLLLEAPLTPLRQGSPDLFTPGWAIHQDSQDRVLLHAPLRFITAQGYKAKSAKGKDMWGGVISGIHACAPESPLLECRTGDSSFLS